MKIKQLKYKTREGKVKKTANYYIDTTYRYKRIRFSGYSDEHRTRVLGEKIESLISHKSLDRIPPANELDWIKGQPARITDKLIKLGIIESGWIRSDRDLKQLIQEFEASLRFKKRSERSIKTLLDRLKKLVRDCGFRKPTDITLDAVQRYVTDLNVAEQTRIHYIRAAKQFTRWMTNPPAILEKNVLEHLPAGTVARENQVEPRRILSTEQIKHLLRVTEASQNIYNGLNGAERGLIYRLAMETGLRAGEVRKLKKRDFDFAENSVITRRKKRVNTDKVSLPLRPATANRIADYAKQKLPNVQVFKVPARAGEMLQKDLRDAGIEYITDDGRVDFHALRHTFASLLVKSGTHPRIAQELLRHSSIDLTMSIYSHINRAETSQAVNNLPDFDSDASSEKQA